MLPYAQTDTVFPVPCMYLPVTKSVQERNISVLGSYVTMSVLATGPPFSIPNMVASKCTEQDTVFACYCFHAVLIQELL